MSKVAIVFWSGTGNTETMAGAVETGVLDAGGEAEVVELDDFTAAKVGEYDAIAFGCPSMGDEVLEEGEFEPMWEAVKDSLTGKKVAMFGSYDWGDGQWMRDWTDEAKELGANVVDYVICNLEPDDEGLENCKQLGAKLV